MKARVLVVDDDTALAEMLTIVLRTEGFEPIVASTATAPWRLFGSASPIWCCWT